MVIFYRVVAQIVFVFSSTFLVGIFISALWPTLIYFLNKTFLGGKNPPGNPPTPRTAAVWFGFLFSALLTLCSTVAVVIADSLPVISQTETAIMSTEEPVSARFATVQPISTILMDNFDGGNLDVEIWSFTSNSNGAGYAVNAGYLTIDGGMQEGGGGTIKSQDSFTLDRTGLRFEARVRTSVPGSGTPLAWWGVVGPPYNSALMGFDSTHTGITTLTANGIVTPDATGNNYHRLDGDTTKWHEFTIEIHPNQTFFFVDNTLEYTKEQIFQADIPLQVVIDCGSGATNQWIEVDYVTLNRIPAVK
jgi:hypothetical protein